MARFVATSINNPKTIIDDQVSPPWIMVPRGLAGAKNVILEDGAGLDLALANPVTAPGVIIEEADEEIGTGRRELTLAGGALGTYLLQAKRGAQIVCQLEIAVKPALKKKISFVRIVDSKGARTRHDDKEVKNFVIALNNIYQPQANIGFELGTITNSQVPFDLSAGVPFMDEVNVPPAPGLKKFTQKGNPLACVMGKPPGPMGCDPNDPAAAGLPSAQRDGIRLLNTWSNIFARLDRDADFNVFLVKKLDVPMNPGNLPSVLAFTVGSGCILSDWGSGIALAHEVGHWLLGTRHDTGKFSHSTGRNDLMQAAPGICWKISKDQVNKMNPT